MPRQKPTDKMEALRLKQAQITAQLKALEAREADAARKADTRRKVIAGALALEHMEKNPDSTFAKQLVRLLDEYVTQSAARALVPSLPAKIEQSAGEVALSDGSGMTQQPAG